MYRGFLEKITAICYVAKTKSGTNEEARELVWKRVPSFVYYANYGNLDSKFISHVIANLKRTDLGAHEAQARTFVYS